jgi:hypothetical protein
MLLFENSEQKLINILKFVGSPFKKFVSTGEIEEDIRLVQSRNDFLQDIITIIEKDENFILPIIGDVGLGKTHLYWALKHELFNFNIVYISLETVYKKFYYNTYAEFIENLSDKSEDRVEPLRNMTKRLCNEWDTGKRRFGFFQIPDAEKVKEQAFKNWEKEFENKDALMEAITAITAHQCEPDKKLEAERWLIGDLMDIRDLSRLNLKHDLRKRTIAFTMLKVLVENLKKESVLFVDDFERIISIQKPIYEESDDVEDIEEVFDPRWFGTKETPQNFTSEKVLDKILDLHKIKGLGIIITLKSIDYLDEIKRKIENKNPILLEILKEPLIMSNFREEDIFQFYKRNLEFFFSRINYNDYFTHFSDSYFPLNEGVLNHIFHEAKGNPREVLKYFIKIFNNIITSNEKLDEILNNYQ